MKTAYHYTSLACWNAIKEDGVLHRYPLAPRDTVLQYAPRGMSRELGIFVWPNWETGLSQAGIILDRVVNKRAMSVVCLEVKYRQRHSLALRGDREVRRQGFTGGLTLNHTGDMGSPPDDSWIYHRVPFDVVLADIPLRHVMQVARWDLLELFTCPSPLPPQRTTS